MSEEGKDSHHHHHHHHRHHHEKSQPPPPAVAEYGTFQEPPQPVLGFPQPVPPPGALEPSGYYARGYQSVPEFYWIRLVTHSAYCFTLGNVVDEKGAASEPRLPCCGIGLGWFLSIDLQEKPGYVACAIAAVLAVIGLIFDLIWILPGRW